MSIIQNQTNTDNSPWYDIMEERALTWGEFAEENQMEVSGYYNAFIVVFNINNCKTKIAGLRQVPRVSTIWVPSSLEQMTETFTIIYKSTIKDKRNFVLINRGSLLNLFRSNYRSNKKYGKLSLFYNNESEFLKLRNTNILEYEHLRKLKISKNKVKLVLYELPSDSNIIQSFLDFCKTLSQ